MPAVFTGVSGRGVEAWLAERMYRVVDDAFKTMLGVLAAGVVIAAASIAASLFVGAWGLLGAALGALVALGGLLGVRVRVKRLGVAHYPLGVVPYGDGRAALLVDLGGRSGSVEVAIPRVDRVAGSVERILAEAESVAGSLDKPEAEGLVVVEAGSSALLSSRAELRLLELLGEAARVLREAPVERYALSLVEPRTRTPRLVEASGSAEPPASMLERDSEALAAAAGRVQAMLASLSAAYASILDEAVKVAERSWSALSRYYSLLEALVDHIHDYARLPTLLLYTPLCPRCYAEQSTAGLARVALDPPVLEPRLEDGVIRYYCRRCGSVYAAPLYPGVAPSPLLVYRFELLFDRVWGRLYLERLDEINRFVSAARREKDEAWGRMEQEAAKTLSELASRYMDAYTRIVEHATLAEKSAELVEALGGSISCDTSAAREAWEAAHRVGARLESILRGETLSRLLEAYSELRRLRIDTVYMNEDMLARVIEAYRSIGARDLAERLEELTKSRDLEELLKLVTGGGGA